MEFNFDFEMTKENKKMIEELLKQKGVKHYVLETKNKEKLNLVEYKDYEELEKENQKLKADYGNKAQVERDLLEEENKQLKEQLKQKEDIINKIKKYLRENEKEYGSLEENEKIILQILDNKGE